MAKKMAALYSALGSKRSITHVFRVPEVISSVTKMTLFLSLFGSLVSHESWNFTIFGCCNCFSISASSLNLALSAFEYLSCNKRKKWGNS